MQQSDNPTADNPFTRGHAETARRLRQRDATVEKSRLMLRATQKGWDAVERAKRPKFDPPYKPSGPFWNPT